MNLKTTILTLCAILLAAGCDKGGLDNHNLIHRDFTAAIDGAPQTRTSLASGGSVLWDESGEGITIVDELGATYDLSQTAVSADRKSATFSGEVPQSGCKYAIYPAQPEVDYESGLVSLGIPTTQEAVEGGFETATNIAISLVGTDGNLLFKNICGLIGFTVANSDVNTIRFSATEISGGALTGTALVEYTGSDPDCVSDIDKGADYVELEGDIKAGRTYYAIAFPGTYKDFTITFTDNDGRTATYTKSDANLVVERSKVVNVSPFTIADGDWTSDELPGGTASLSYSELPTPSTYVKGYGSPAEYTNEFGKWTICAYNYTNKSAFQLNKDKVAYIGTPAMPGVIKSVTVTIASGETTNGKLCFCSERGSNSTPAGSLIVPCEGSVTTVDVSSLDLKQIWIRADDFCARITDVSLVYGSYIPGDDPGPGTNPDPGPDPVVPPYDPNAKADYGWFELPAQTDKDCNGIDDVVSDYYYSHTFRADAPRIRNFSCCYSKYNMQPVWVAAPMHSCYKGSSGRNDSYKADPNIKCAQASKVDGYTRGHMLGSSDRTVSKETNRQVFYYSNIGAQLQSGFNTGGGSWNNLESLTDGQWCADTLYQVIGCIFTSFTDRYGKTVEPRTVGSVHVPTAYYKVLIRTKSGKTGKRLDQCTASEIKCAAFILAHRSNAGHKPSASDMYTVSELEAITGLNYFVNVPNAPKGTAVASDWGL